MSPLSLFPVVVWMVDTDVEPVVRTWHGSLASEARLVVRLASSFEEAQAAIREFATLDFGKRLQERNIALGSSGVRVRAVLIGSGMRPAFAEKWAEIERRLDKLEIEVLEIARIRMFLVDTADIRNDERVICLDGLSRGAWVLSTRLDTRQTLSTYDFSRCVKQALNALLFADAHGSSSSSIWKEIPTGTVLLAGFPTDDPAAVHAQVVKALTRHLLDAVRHGKTASTKPPAEARRSFVSAAQRVAVGSVSADEALTRVLGRTGLASWTLAQLVAEGPGALAAAIDAAERPDPFAARPSHSRGRELPLTWWQRLLVALGLLKKEAPEAALGADLPIDTRREVDYLKARLAEARELIEGVLAPVKSLQPEVEVTQPHLLRWAGDLQEDVRGELLVIARESGGTSRSPTDLLNQLAERIRTDVEATLWSTYPSLTVKDAGLRRAVESVRSGGHFVFSASLLTGEHPCPEAAVTSLPLSISGRLAVCRYLPSAQPVLFASSAPYPPSSLTW